MKLNELRLNIVERRLDGETYQSIANYYGVTKSMIFQIEKGYRPGKKISAVLNLEPSEPVIQKRIRRQKLDKIAQSWGYKGWWDYGSKAIEKFDIENDIKIYNERMKNERIG